MRLASPTGCLLLLAVASCEQRSPGQPAEPPRTPMTTDSPVPSGDPFDAIADVQKRTVAKRFDELLEPVTGKDGIVRKVEGVVKEADKRAVAVMQLSRYKLEFKDGQGEKNLLDLVARVGAVQPEGSVVRRGDQPRALRTARKLLEEELHAGAPINRAARTALAKLAPVHRPDPRFRFGSPLPDISEKLLSQTLTADDLLPFLFHLSDCRQNIEYFREEDRKLYELILTFGEKDRFRLVQHASFALDVFHIDQTFINKDKELRRLHLTTYAPALGSKEWNELFEKRVKPVFVEQARAYQNRVADYFAFHDRWAIQSLAELQKLQDEYYRYVLATVPNFKYRLRPIVPLGPDGKPVLKAREPFTFSFDFSDYVEIESSVNSIDDLTINHHERVKPLKK